MLKVLDLFSGIGGFSCGLERTDRFETVSFCEQDAYATRVLAKNWPGVPVHPDVTRYEFQEGEADVITAGFPCQDISLAGAGAGLAGARSGLYRHVVRAIRLVRPRFTILENVAALLGRGMGTVLGDLAEIGADAEWHCIPASAVGAPHRRDRVWIIADTGSEQHEGHRAPLSGTLATELVGTSADPDSPRLPLSGQEPAGTYGEQGGGASAAGGWWASEPDVGRVAHGVRSRVDRLRCLGNAVVPQIPELIGRAILAAEAARSKMQAA